MRTHERGVDYNTLDRIKRLAQEKARSTEHWLERNGVKAVPSSRGEPAFVWEESDRYVATVVEGPGTKPKIANIMRRVLRRSSYDVVGYDLVASISNDVLTSGAQPIAISPFWSAGSIWPYLDEEKQKDLIKGHLEGVNDSYATWAGGETQVLRGLIFSKEQVFGGSGIGYVKPKERFANGEKIKEGDVILIVESNGLHTNGYTPVRNLARSLPKGFSTRLSNGKMLGEELLQRSIIYVPLIRKLQSVGIEIHYMAHITGHGWAKIIRATQDFRYVIDNLPKPQVIFDFTQKHLEYSDRDMYKTFNMGAGYAIILPEDQAEKALMTNYLSSGPKFTMFKAGYVEKGTRELIITPKGIKFTGEDVDIR